MHFLHPQNPNHPGRHQDRPAPPAGTALPPHPFAVSSAEKDLVLDIRNLIFETEALCGHPRACQLRNDSPEPVPRSPPTARHAVSRHREGR